MILCDFMHLDAVFRKIWTLASDSKSLWVTPWSRVFSATTTGFCPKLVMSFKTINFIEVGRHSPKRWHLFQSLAIAHIDLRVVFFVLFLKQQSQLNFQGRMALGGLLRLPFFQMVCYPGRGRRNRPNQILGVPVCAPRISRGRGTRSASSAMEYL